MTTWTDYSDAGDATFRAVADRIEAAPEAAEAWRGGNRERAAEELTQLTEEMGLYARLAVDADGFVWWVHEGGSWSMARTNPDNSPIPQPVTFYAPIQEATEVSAQVVTTTEVVTFKYDDEGRVVSQTTETVTTSTEPVTA